MDSHGKSQQQYRRTVSIEADSKVNKEHVIATATGGSWKQSPENYEGLLPPRKRGIYNDGF